MEALGWVVMVGSLTFVSVLMVWCYARVFGSGSGTGTDGRGGGGIVWTSQQLRTLAHRRKKPTTEIMNRRPPK